jgi:hypothetical protein
MIGTLVALVPIIGRGQLSTLGVSLVTIAASGVVIALSARGGPSSSLPGKWVVIGAAALAAVPLVVSASGR